MGPTLTFKEYKGSRPLSPTVSGMKEHAEMSGIPMSREPGLTYLFNGSNMCFINCVLQALSQIPGFVNKFLDDSILDIMHPVTSHTADGRLTLGLGDVFKRLWLGKQKLINASEFKALLTQAHAGYDNDDQQDAHEFFLDLMLSVLQSTRMFPFHDKIWRVPTVRRYPGVRLADRKYRNALLSHKGVSPLAEDFVGQLRTTFTCHQCYRLKHYYENFLTLELELPSKGTSRTLEQLFKDNISSPVLYPSMRCGFCEKASFRSKAFDRLPRVFVIQLRRYGRSPTDRNRYVKLFNYVDFPVTLNMLPFLKDATDGYFMFDLRGVIQHMGPETDCGHYTSKVRYLYRTDEDDWRMIDDHRSIDKLDDPMMEINPKVRPALRSTIFTPYVLFYVARPHEGRLYKLSDPDVTEHPIISAGTTESDFIMPATIRYNREISEGGIEYLKRLTDPSPRIRTSWVPGDPITVKHALYHAPMCALFKKMKPVPRRPAIPQLRQVQPLDEECVEEIEWTDEEIVVGHRVVGGDDAGRDTSEERRVRGGGHVGEKKPDYEEISDDDDYFCYVDADDDNDDDTAAATSGGEDLDDVADLTSCLGDESSGTRLHMKGRLRGGGGSEAERRRTKAEDAATRASMSAHLSTSTAFVPQGVPEPPSVAARRAEKEARAAQEASTISEKEPDQPRISTALWYPKTSECPASSWFESITSNIDDSELKSWSKKVAKRVARMDAVIEAVEPSSEDTSTSSSGARSRAGMAKKTKLPPCPRQEDCCDDPASRSILGDLSLTLERKPELVEYVLDQLVTMIQQYQEEREILRQRRFDAWNSYINQVQNDCHRKEELEVLQMLEITGKKKGDPAMDASYVWQSYVDSEVLLQERAGALDELNRSIANKEAAVEKLATEEDWLREQQATYLTPESQARFLRYWMKQSRKRGTQAVLDFKQSSLQRYLADRKPIIDTLVLLKRIDENFSKRNRGFNWAIDALGAHLTNCKEPRNSYLFQKLFPNIKDGSLPHYPSIARYWETVGREARVFEHDLQAALKEVKNIVPTLRSLFPDSSGGYEILDDFDETYEEDKKKSLGFYPVLPLGY